MTPEFMAEIKKALVNRDCVEVQVTFKGGNRLVHMLDCLGNAVALPIWGPLKAEGDKE